MLASICCRHLHAVVASSLSVIPHFFSSCHTATFFLFLSFRNIFSVSFCHSGFVFLLSFRARPGIQVAKESMLTWTPARRPEWQIKKQVGVTVIWVSSLIFSAEKMSRDLQIFPFLRHKHSLANIYKKTPQGTIVTLRSFGERNQIQTLRYLIWFGFSRLRLIKSGGGRGGPGLKHPDTTHMFAARWSSCLGLNKSGRKINGSAG